MTFWFPQYETLIYGGFPSGRCHIRCGLASEPRHSGNTHPSEYSGGCGCHLSGMWPWGLNKFTNGQLEHLSVNYWKADSVCKLKHGLPTGCPRYGCLMFVFQHLQLFIQLTGKNDVGTRHVTMLPEIQDCCQWLMWQATGLDGAVVECFLSWLESIFWIFLDSFLA